MEGNNSRLIWGTDLFLAGTEETHNKSLDSLYPNWDSKNTLTYKSEVLLSEAAYPLDQNAVNCKFPNIQTSRIITQLTRILERIFHFCDAIQKQICYALMCICDMIVLPAASSSTACSSSQREHSWICDHVAVYVYKIFRP
jgi:hypothetical protein